MPMAGDQRQHRQLSTDRCWHATQTSLPSVCAASVAKIPRVSRRAGRPHRRTRAVCGLCAGGKGIRQGGGGFLGGGGQGPRARLQKGADTVGSRRGGLHVAGHLPFQLLREVISKVMALGFRLIARGWRLSRGAVHPRGGSRKAHAVGHVLPDPAQYRSPPVQVIARGYSFAEIMGQRRDNPIF